MARVRKTGSVEIVHSSFIDLLFGAFGAFVFIMITYVILTMNLTPDEVKGVIDHYANANKALTGRVEDLDGQVTELTTQVAEKQKVEDENSRLEKELEQARKEAAEAAETVAGLEKEKEAAETQVAALKDKIKGLLPFAEANKDIDKQIEELKGLLAQATARADKAEAGLREWQDREPDLQEKTKGLEEKLARRDAENKQLKEQLADLEKEKREEAKEQDQPPGDNLEGTRGTVHAWLKYLFLLFLYILGSELSTVLNGMAYKAQTKIFKEDDIEEVVDYATGKRTYRGGKADTADKIIKARKKYVRMRTLLWLSIIIAAGIYLVRVMGMSLGNIWIPGTIAIVLYAYLRKRFDLI